MDTCTIAPAGTAERRMNMLSGAKVTKELLNALDNVKKPQTNADRIRAMSDEELATFISEIANECEINTECNQHCYGCDIEYCVHESCLKWLQQPVKEMWL